MEFNAGTAKTTNITHQISLSNKEVIVLEVLSNGEVFIANFKCYRTLGFKLLILILCFSGLRMV